MHFPIIAKSILLNGAKVISIIFFYIEVCNFHARPLHYPVIYFSVRHNLLLPTEECAVTFLGSPYALSQTWTGWHTIATSPLKLISHMALQRTHPMQEKAKQTTYNLQNHSSFNINRTQSMLHIMNSKGQAENFLNKEFLSFCWKIKSPNKFL